MRKRSEQVYSRESSATLQLTVSLLYHVNGNQMQTGVIDDMISKDKSHMRIIIS